MIKITNIFFSVALKKSKLQIIKRKNTYLRNSQNFFGDSIVYKCFNHVIFSIIRTKTVAVTRGLVSIFFSPF